MNIEKVLNYFEKEGFNCKKFSDSFYEVGKEHRIIEKDSSVERLKIFIEIYNSDNEWRIVRKFYGVFSPTWSSSAERTKTYRFYNYKEFKLIEYKKVLINICGPRNIE